MEVMGAYGKKTRKEVESFGIDYYLKNGNQCQSSEARISERSVFHLLCSVPCVVVAGLIWDSQR